MAKANVSLKVGTPEIRVPLDAVKKPKSSMMKVTGTKKSPTFTNEASMPKNKKMKLPKRAKC
jgi:hypothetical protein